MRSRLPWVHAGEHRSARFARWGELLWRRPLVFGAARSSPLVALALPVIGLKTAMPSIKVVPATGVVTHRLRRGAAAFGAGAPGQLQIITRRATQVAEPRTSWRRDPGIAAVSPAQSRRTARTWS